MILPASFTDPLTNAPAHLKLFQSFEPRENFVQMFGATEAIVKESLAAEYGMIEMIDDAIGQVLAKLEQKNMLDNTVILFTSDHGDMFGEHGLMLKGMMHYQGCLRVPMTIAGPGIRPGRSSSLVSSLDIPQTLLDLAALPEFDHMQGSSFVPVIEDPATSIRDHVYIEEDLPLFESTRIPHKVRTLVTQDARISTYSTGETEIFNLVDDPAEMNNLAVTDPSSETAINLKDRLTNALIQYSDLARLNAR